MRLPHPRSHSAISMFHQGSAHSSNCPRSRNRLCRLNPVQEKNRSSAQYSNTIFPFHQGSPHKAGRQSPPIRNRWCRPSRPQGMSLTNQYKATIYRSPPDAWHRGNRDKAHSCQSIQFPPQRSQLTRHRHLLTTAT